MPGSPTSGSCRSTSARSTPQRAFRADTVDQPRGVERVEAGLVDRHPRLGDLLADDTLLGQRPAECGTGNRSAAHVFEGTFGNTDRAHAVVDATGAEPRLRDR